MDKGNFLLGHRIDIFEEINALWLITTSLSDRSDSLHMTARYSGAGSFKTVCKRRHHRHAQITHKFQQMAAGRTAENTVFMLHADNIRLADIEELRRGAVIAQFVLVDLKTHFFRIGYPSGLSFMAAAQQLISGASADRPSTRSVVKVAIPHWRGR
jgi:hypothetical protein